MTRPTSLVLVNTGDGKGKSSAAMGVMGRGWARGWRVAVVQFIKSGRWRTGEEKLAGHLGIEWHSLGDGFTWESDDLDETAAHGRRAWEVARRLLTDGEHDLVILDEMTYAIMFSWIDEGEVVAAIAERHPGTHVVITGRDASDGLLAVADTVTEMRNVKHAFDAGIPAKKGIEF